jgi:hypothetical protein
VRRFLGGVSGPGRWHSRPSKGVAEGPAQDRVNRWRGADSRPRAVSGLYSAAAPASASTTARLFKIGTRVDESCPIQTPTTAHLKTNRHARVRLVAATDIAAWLGAVAGSLALLFDYIKWLRSGARLTVSANPNMLLLESTRNRPAEPHMVVWVRNTGDAPTTLTAMAFEHYPNHFWRMVRRRSTAGIILRPDPEPLPKVLAPGEQWTTVVRPAPQIAAARSVGVLVGSIWHSMTRKPTRFIVRFPGRHGKSD